MNNFLESSSIHGLNYISTTRKCVKLFWILVVLTGFTGAVILVHQSFKAWEESPVSTTIETRPIPEITFPKVTVCPLKNTFTDLNYDLVKIQNMTLDKNTRKDLAKYAVELVQEELYNMVMKNLSLLQDDDKYYNWYHGYSLIGLPYIQAQKYEVYYTMRTYATSGTFYTNYFGEKFDADKVNTDVYYNIEIIFPESILQDDNASLNIKFEKNSITDLSSGHDKFLILGGEIRSNETNWTKNYTLSFLRSYAPQCRTLAGNIPRYCIVIGLKRKVLFGDLKKMEQDLTIMPGFKIQWYYYSEVEKKGEPRYYEEFYRNILFIRFQIYWQSFNCWQTKICWFFFTLCYLSHLYNEILQIICFT